MWLALYTVSYLICQIFNFIILSKKIYVNTCISNLEKLKASFDHLNRHLRPLNRPIKKHVALMSHTEP